MGKKLIPVLSSEQKKELETTYRHGTSHAIRIRAHIILLKAAGHSSKYIVSLPGYPNQQNSVNDWVKRYESEGISGLKNADGQGRKPILNPVSHEEKVKTIVQSERQRLDYAKTLIEEDLGVQMSKRTLTRFLKRLTGLTNESERP
jgi:transposase